MSYQYTGNPSPTKYGDGTGRNSYIVCGIGGDHIRLQDKQHAPQFYHPKMAASPMPRHVDKAPSYVNDGSGRDTYVSASRVKAFSKFKFEDSLRGHEPMHAVLRPFSAYGRLERERFLEQRQSCSRLAQPKRVATALDTRTKALHERDVDRDLYGAPIRTRAYTARVRCVGNQRNPNDGFKAATFSKSAVWLSNQKQ
mmetsp:Transcript_29320/g.75281  ORF Transcript_29320/g.75281 Transcript_29320/m.75281 type:complete len:197 (+) Transcript_29320:126-716(+)|eukprot:jgi/Tetstr1/438678/TSEL_027228.t1